MLKLIEALQKGRELADPTTWKNRQNTMNLVVAVMSLVTFGLRLAGVDLKLSDDQLSGIAEAVAVVLGVVNMFFINATSKKVGL